MWQYLIDDLYKVFNEGAFINLVINNRLPQIKDEHLQKLYTKVMYGVVEQRRMLDFILKPYTTGKRFKPYLKNTLRIGIYGLSYLNIANHYLVNELVNTTKQRDFKGSKAINGILRTYLKENGYQEALKRLHELDAFTQKSIIYSIDEDIIRLLNQQYPDQLASIFESIETPLNTYRINTVKTTITEIKDVLDKKKIPYELMGMAIMTPVSLIDLPIFQDGKIIAQDLSSMRVAEVANPAPNMDVLDVCAAPGSKSFHMAALMNNTGTILSCDIYPHKLKLLEDGATKLGINNIRVMLASGTDADYGKSFDIVLLDAPCSGLGTLRHKSDLKERLTLEKMEELAALQKHLLGHVASFVKTKGVLVYSTCTINPLENEEQMQMFLNNHHEFRKEFEQLILPSEIQDGFYICKLRKEQGS